MRFLAAFPALLLAACQTTQPVPPGESLLQLADRDFARATPQLARARLQALMDHLKLDDASRARVSELLGHMDATPSLEKAEQMLQWQELSNRVVLAKHDAVIGFLRDAIVIAGGAVRISHASNAIVIAGRDIDVSGDGSPFGVLSRDRSGFYVARGRVTISHAVDPIIYAAQGVTFSHFGKLTAYNTDVREGGYGQIVRYVRPPIFIGEIARRDEPPSMVIATGGADGAYTGRRCELAAPEERVRSYAVADAQRRHECAKLESVRVRCVGQDGQRSEERWIIGLCGKEEEYVVTVAPNVTTMNRRADLEAVPPRIGGTDPDALRRAQKLHGEALALEGRGQRSEALAAYDRALQADADFVPSLNNRAYLKQRQGDVHGAVEDFSRGLRVQPRNANLLSGRGLAYLQLGDAVKGLADLDESIKAGGTDGSLLVNRGVAYFYLGRFAQALTDVDRALEKSPQSLSVIEAKMWICLAAGESSVQDAGLAIDVFERSPSLQAHYGSRVGYYVLFGYLDLVRKAQDDEARAWAAKWRKHLNKTSVPGALVLHFLGETDEAGLAAVARGKDDERELVVFQGWNKLYRGRKDEAGRFFAAALKDQPPGYSRIRIVAETGARAAERSR